MTLPVPENKSSAHFFSHDVAFDAGALKKWVDDVDCGAIAPADVAVWTIDEVDCAFDVDRGEFSTREDE